MRDLITRQEQCPAGKRQTGFSLLEVLVSVTILVLGLLGLAALQTRTLMMSQSSFYRGIAADLAANLAERIHANKSPYLASSDAEIQPALPPDFSACTQDTSDRSTLQCASQPSGHESYLIETEMREWNTALRNQLPDSGFTLTTETGSSAGHFRYTLTISWLDDRSQVNTSAQSSQSSSSSQSSVQSQTTSYSVVIE